MLSDRRFPVLAEFQLLTLEPYPESAIHQGNLTAHPKETEKKLFRSKMEEVFLIFLALGKFFLPFSFPSSCPTLMGVQLYRNAFPDHVNSLDWLSLPRNF